jgi:hypothetical protein
MQNLYGNTLDPLFNYMGSPLNPMLQYTGGQGLFNIETAKPRMPDDEELRPSAPPYGLLGR